MKKSRLLLIIAALGFAAAGNGQRKELALPSGYPYGAAFISTISAAPGHTDLVVFPVSGSAFKIPIRSARGGFRYSPDGTALYGACTPHPDPVRADEPPKVALCKIDLNTTTTTPVLETTGLHAYGFAISRFRRLASVYIPPWLHSCCRKNCNSTSSSNAALSYSAPGPHQEIHNRAPIPQSWHSPN